MVNRIATCSCGQIELRCEGEPVSVSLCHCLECQKRTGGPFGIAAFFPREAVVPSGRATSWERPSDSGFPVTFHFCPACGSTVWWEPARKPEVIAVAPGAFADPAFPPPAKSVYEHHRHHWLPAGI